MIILLLSTLSFVFISYLCIVRFVYFATAKKEAKGCTIANEDKWNPIKWISFARGTAMEYVLPKHELEQLVERYTHPDCQKCLEKGCCISCGCETYAKMLDPNAACSNGNWFPMMSQEDWEARKEFLKSK